MKMKNWIEWTQNSLKFEKKFERERTANFCFCPSIVSHNLVVTRIPLTMSGANTDEYPYCFNDLSHNSAVKKLKGLGKKDCFTSF